MTFRASSFRPLLAAAAATCVFAAHAAPAETPAPLPDAGLKLQADNRLRQVIPMAGEARTAGIADGVTTAVALLSGGVELNPIGPLASAALKPVLMAYARTLPQEKQADYFSAFTSIWGGAAANNLCVAASVLSGGGFAPACVAVGVAWGAKKWNDTGEERAFWKEGCPQLREQARNQDLKCVYVRGAETVKTASRRQDGVTIMSAAGVLTRSN